MAIGILGKKLGMTQIFTDEGKVIPVTVIKAGPCLVLQKKTVKSDGYDAVQIGLVGPTPKRLRGKAVAGHLKKSQAGNISFIREIKGSDMHHLEIGAMVPLALLAENDLINVVGSSKGKGFQGVIKRHHFAGLPETHGTHKKQRSPGSIGMCAYPPKTLRGKRMPGRMGGARTTIRNLTVVRLDLEQNHILVKGAVPGAINGKLILMKGCVGQTADQNAT